MVVAWPYSRKRETEQPEPGEFFSQLLHIPRERLEADQPIQQFSLRNEVRPAQPRALH